MTDEDAPHYLRLSAQRALLGHVTPNLRAFSVEKYGRTIRTLAVFAEEPTPEEVELTQFAGTEIVADFVDAFIVETVAVSSARPVPRLMQIVYERWEPDLP